MTHFMIGNAVGFRFSFLSERSTIGTGGSETGISSFVFLSEKKKYEKIDSKHKNY